MDYTETDTNDFSVSEGAFWHTNMDLYYGYRTGEVVEVEHESNKYWLATIRYSFKQLILLKWIGDYGEFWIDTSSSSTVNSNNAFDQLSGPKRLFPPGYHLQSQLKSQFTLERPTKVLEKPSLYNPANDPYAEIETVEDLLKHEISNSNQDAFGNKSPSSSRETNLLMATCKATIAYGQEDVDELEAALLNLTENQWVSDIPSDSTYGSNLNSSNSTSTNNLDHSVSVKSEPNFETNKSIRPEIDLKSEKVDGATSQTFTKSETKEANKLPAVNEMDHETPLKLCKSIQDRAISQGKYSGIDEDCEKVFFTKPKQLFDMGGANHEKVLVPGTLLEICHTSESEFGLELNHWFAVILKNIGGRLKLRWFLCDEPKFKQGRLELKSCKSSYIKEEEEDEDCLNDGEKCGLIPKTKIPAKDTLFSMHFCHPSVHTISHGKLAQRVYKMPSKIFSFIKEVGGFEEALSIERSHKEYIFDPRRMNLDKERPIIDHLLSTVRCMSPKYIKLSFSSNNDNNNQEILLSAPKQTKLLRGFLKRELELGVYEVNSVPSPEDGEVVKFIYPYDSSYSILPLDWAEHNLDCLSVSPSRNLTPSPKNEQEEPEGQPSTNFTGMCENPNVDARENLFADLNAQKQTQVLQRDGGDQDFSCIIDQTVMGEMLAKFKVMTHLEVVHPSSDTTICLGRIRKVVFPLLWIQISNDSYTLLPFNSTDIYPSKWCELNNHPLISLIPPRKRCNQSTQLDKKRKRIKNEDDMESDNAPSQKVIYEKEHFDLSALTDKQLDIDYILNEKCMYIRIYFNHKCFTGPSLSKGKICSLPQYVGPGPLRLVMEEVVTKVISVAYVPPRILNDLSSKSFEELLIARNLINTTPMEFKAKYQKRVHREDIPVCLNPDDVALYCECVCEHLKCCYNLFGPNLYDGDDCPGHCRALTKSNKFMKRATYYREKARLGEFISDNGSSKKPSSNARSNPTSKTSRARYAGRDSSESTSSSLSRSEQVNSRASSSAGEDGTINELKENLVAVEEMEDEEDNGEDVHTKFSNIMTNDVIHNVAHNKDAETTPGFDKILHSAEQIQNVHNVLPDKPISKETIDSEFNMFENMDLRPIEWSVNDVAQHLEWCQLDTFKLHMMSEGVDGQALMLLDKVAIREHFQHQPKSEYTPDDVGKLCRFVEFVKTRTGTTATGT